MAMMEMEMMEMEMKMKMEMKMMEMEMEMEMIEMEMEKESPKMAMMEMEMMEMEMMEMEMEMEMEMMEIKRYYEEPMGRGGQPFEQKNQFLIGTTTYADLNQVSSGEDVYSGNTTNLVVTDAGSSAASGAELNDVVGSFRATTTINYSSRTVTQGATITVNKLGQNTTARNFSVSNDNSYSSATGNVQPKNAYNISGDNDGNSVTNVESKNSGSLTKTVTTDATYVEAGTKADTHYFVTVEADIQNTSGQVPAGTVQTTVTVSSEQTDGGDLNVASGTDTPANKN